MKKQILIQITNQKLSAFEENKKVFDFNCVTGDAGHPTPKGKFKILSKSKKYRSHTYDSQMNYALKLTNSGIFIHESYNYETDPNNFSPFASLLSDSTANLMSYMRSTFPEVSKTNIGIGNINLMGSHGCIRLPHSDAAKLFDWAEVGTLVEIK